MSGPFHRVLRRLLVIAALVACAWTIPVVAHDLPTDVVVQVFVKPQGQRLHLLVRVPLRAMGNVDYPTRGSGGAVDLTKVEPALRSAVDLWIVPALELYEDDARLERPTLTAVRISLPSDRSFGSYENALALITGPGLAPDTELDWNQGMLDVALDFAIRSDRSPFVVNPLMARLGVRVVTAVRFLPPGGAVRAFEFVGDPGHVVLDPRGWQAAWRFVQLGVAHILGGTDHLLFLVCLVVPVRRFRAMVPVVTAFAVAHSITLIGSAFSLAPSALWFPAFIETLIAVSIVYMAGENILAGRFGHRWIVAFGFGLVHGFGFSFALRESLQFAGSHLVASLLAFNVGVELGQLVVLAIVIPPLRLLVRHAVSERVATIAVSAVIAHTAWHWMTGRWQTLTQYSFRWPELDAAFGATVMGWLLLAVVAGTALWALSALAAWASRPTPRRSPPQSTP